VETAVTELPKYGLAGIMFLVLVSLGAVVLRIAWATTQKQIEARESDLAWHRRELSKERQEFTEALIAQRAEHTAAMASLRVEHTAALAAQQKAFTDALGQFGDASEHICQRLEQIEVFLRKYMETR